VAARLPGDGIWRARLRLYGPTRHRAAVSALRPTAIHALENLANSETGIVMLRRLLREQLQRVEQGLDPINVIRDPSANKRIPTGAWNTILSPAEAAALPCSENL